MANCSVACSLIICTARPNITPSMSNSSTNIWQTPERHPYENMKNIQSTLKPSRYVWMRNTNLGSETCSTGTSICGQGNSGTYTPLNITSTSFWEHQPLNTHHTKLDRRKRNSNNLKSRSIFLQESLSRPTRSGQRPCYSHQKGWTASLLRRLPKAQQYDSEILISPRTHGKRYRHPR